MQDTSLDSVRLLHPSMYSDTLDNLNSRQNIYPRVRCLNCATHISREHINMHKQVILLLFGFFFFLFCGPADHEA